ncbi:Uncharacterized conserved protein, DUF924 family [Salinihabitans flavidus]|uniref:Uncharacterized conserved protein, DUF924 family n=1 Tax=Salinihabitans flavidus TaxID=569882 RepID=A0A1H8QBN3_9RHOB|nr:DUF924 family protein [Salinihabitans flavidus]SEO51629.1 Uncharacterized conserved protein, DUF924 family [Salinihabitans flavidus]
MAGPEEILNFWLDEVGPDGWYKVDEALDQEIRDRFGSIWQRAMDGGYAQWLTYASGSLAYIILLDQFPRNMFRGGSMAFASDKIALAAAKSSVHHKYDLKIDEPARQFFYLPLMHSENLCDQDRCVRLMKERMPETGAHNMLHAKAHREVIREFGRFPYRNEALKRSSTGPERAFMERGGYAETLRALERKAEAA